MSNQPSSTRGTKEHAISPAPSFDPLTHPKYFEAVGTICSQRLVSSLRPPSAFTISKGFIVSSRSEAVDAIERFASFEQKLPNKLALGSGLRDLEQPSSRSVTIEFPETLLSTRPLLLYYGSCTISPFGTTQWAIQFGDGVIPHELVTHMRLPSMVMAEQRKFCLEPIPHTRGAKAFSVPAATAALADVITSHPQVSVKSLTPDLRIEFECEQFVASLGVFCRRFGSEHYHEDLVIFPCCGTEIPWSFRERLIVTVSPEIAPQYENTEEMSSQAAKLSYVTSLMTSGLQNLFGQHSPKRLKSVAPIFGDAKDANAIHLGKQDDESKRNR